MHSLNYMFRSPVFLNAQLHFSTQRARESFKPVLTPRRIRDRIMSSDQPNRGSKRRHSSSTSNGGSDRDRNRIRLDEPEAGTEDVQTAGAGRGRGLGSAEGGLDDVGPLGGMPSPSGSSSLKSSGSRPLTIHSDPFAELSVPSFESGGPKDPKQEGRVAKPFPGQPVHDEDKDKGFEYDKTPFYTSKWPGVTWHRGSMHTGKKNFDKMGVVVRRIANVTASTAYMEWMDNERKVMNTLKNKYIIKHIEWRPQDDYQFVIFPECVDNMGELVKTKIQGPLEKRKTFIYMGQIAQALALMQPASILIHGNRHAYLGRLMMAQQCSTNKKIDGQVPTGAKNYFFLSPERYRQNVDKSSVFKSNVDPGLLAVETEYLFPTDDGEWDPKADDVWAFGCTVFFVLTGNYPFTTEQARPRLLLQAHKDQFLMDHIQEHEVLKDEAKEFLLWILKPQRDRPTMDEVLRHHWFRELNHPSSPFNAPQVSTEASVHEKSFRHIPGHIDESLVQQMAEKGYSVQYLLGAGGFGAVYKGTWLNRETGVRTPVAMKIIKQKKNGKIFQSHRWSTEYKIMTAFDHPNLVKVYHVFKEVKRPQHAHSVEGRVFIFMELAVMDLAQLVSIKGTIDEPELKSIMSQVLKGLSFLHKNKVVHRDIKPANILICGEDRNVAKLTDYSLVREADSHTISTSAVGTPAYWAPEVCLAKRRLSDIPDVFKLDIWSLGITIFECLNGHRPQWDPKGAAAKSKRRNKTPFIMEYAQMIQQVKIRTGKSEQVIDLMIGMLRMNVEERFSLRQVKNHAWFSKPE